MFTTNSRLPFGVHPHESDPTLAFSTPAENGDLAGRTGVIFTPPIQSGEHLSLAVFFDPKPIPGVDVPGKLDINQLSPRQRSPVFQTWHSIDLVLHAGKKLASGAVGPEFSDMSAAQSFFDPAFVVLRRLKVATRKYLTDLGDYDKTIKDAFEDLLTGYVAPELVKMSVPKWEVDPRDRRPAPVSPKPGRESFFIKDHVFDAETPAKSVGSAMRIFTVEEVTERYRLYAKLAPTMSSDDVQKDLWARAGGQVAFGRYIELASHATAWVAASAGSKLTAAHAPRTGLRITEVFSQAEDKDGRYYSSHVGGMAFADNRRSGHVFLARRFETPLALPFAHEVGHECFLPHPGGRGGDGDPDAHDPDDDKCIMGRVSREHFCGRCVLRLRGWSMKGMQRNG